MPRILLAVDGSECALRATRKLIETVVLYRDVPQIDLVTVHLPVPRVPNMGLFVSEQMIQYRLNITGALGRVARAHKASHRFR